MAFLFFVSIALWKIARRKKQETKSLNRLIHGKPIEHLELCMNLHLPQFLSDEFQRTLATLIACRMRDLKSAQLSPGRVERPRLVAFATVASSVSHQPAFKGVSFFPARKPEGRAVVFESESECESE